MNKPDHIPQDVWEIATGIDVMDESVCDWDYNLAIDISKAIMAAKADEREAFIAVANKERLLGFYVNPEEAPDSDKAYDMAIDHVIDAIRAR